MPETPMRRKKQFRTIELLNPPVVSIPSRRLSWKIADGRMSYTLDEGTIELPPVTESIRYVIG